MISRGSGVLFYDTHTHTHTHTHVGFACAQTIPPTRSLCEKVRRNASTDAPFFLFLILIDTGTFEPRKKCLCVRRHAFFNRVRPCPRAPGPCRPVHLRLPPAPAQLNPTPYTLHPTPYTLHQSDSRLRPDRKALEAGNIALAQDEKVRIEEQQRYERRLREAVHGKHPR